MEFKVLGINHIGLAPKDPAKLKQFFTVLLGLEDLGSELVSEQKTLTHMFRSAHINSTIEPRLESLQPSPEGDGPIAQFLAKRGSGVHHIALAVSNVDAAIRHLLSKNIRMIDQQARTGAHKTKIAFVHPESTGGILVELVEE